MIENFTVEKGLEVQLEHLKVWKRLLKTTAYKALLAEVARQNAREMKDGYEVFRGSAIDTWVNNHARQLQNGSKVVLPLKPFDIEVCRVGYGFATITVMARDQQEAEVLALDEAGGHDFSEKNSEYQIA